MTRKQQQFYLGDLEIVKQEKPSCKKAAYSCSTCKLDQSCRSPEIERCGKGNAGILLVGEFPGSDEDVDGIPFAGPSGDYVSDMLAEYDVDMDRDCVCTYVLKCRLPNRTDPTDDQLKACHSKLVEEIKEIQPELIICLGKYSLKAVIESKGIPAKSKVIERLHGWTFPVHELNAWVGVTLDPGFMRRNPQDDLIFSDDLGRILEHLGEPLPKKLTNAGSLAVFSADDSVRILDKYSKSKKPVAFDYECNCISPYDKGSKLLTVALSNDVEESKCLYIGNPRWNASHRLKVDAAMGRFLKSDAPKVVHSLNMEDCWGRVKFGQAINNLVMDTTVGCHVVNCRKGTVNLDLQVYRMTGHYYSGMVNKKSMATEPFEKIANYNCLDTRYTLMLYNKLRAILDAEGNEDINKFNDFLHSCLPVCVNLRHRGHLVDEDTLAALESEAAKSLADAESNILTCVAGQKYRKEFGVDINIASGPQLIKMFYEVYDVKTRVKVKKGKGGLSTDAATMDKILRASKNKDVKNFIKYMKSMNKPTTMIASVNKARKFMDTSCRMHPSYNLFIAESYRSSSSDPNSQNFPARDPYLKKIRKCIIPRPGHFILEVDMAGIEVRVIAMVSGDPVLKQQIFDGVDTHYRWTARMLSKTIEEVTKAERKAAKNDFVFPTFYGSVPESIASGTGIALEHIKKVQADFWDEYHYAKEWQLKTMADYKETGYVSAVTGFRRPGPLTTEQLYNTPIQGPAFHLVLDALRLIDAEMVKRKYDSFIFSEIHDSIVGDIHPDEVLDYVELAESILTSKRFDWQADVPLAVDWEIGENFYDMESM